MFEQAFKNIDDVLLALVNSKLFPCFHGYKQKVRELNPIEYKIGEIFGAIKNRFQSQKEKHELSHFYRAKAKNMGNAGRNGGEYFNPCLRIRVLELGSEGLLYEIRKGAAP